VRRLDRRQELATRQQTALTPRVPPHAHRWLHWFKQPLDQGGKPTFDLWPDMSELDADERYECVRSALASPQARTPTHRPLIQRSRPHAPH
jgi:hypothetical protein